METALDLANRSLKLILVEADESPLEPSEYEDYYEALNDFMTDMESRGIRLGFRPVTGPADFVTVPRGAIRGLAANVALDVVSTYGGKINPALIKMAQTGMNTIRRLGQKRMKSGYHTNLPIGIGSSDYPDTSATMYDPTPDGALYMAGNTVATEITAVDTPVLVMGEWDTEGFAIISPDVAGRIANRTENPLTLIMDITFTATAAAAADATFTLMKNGAEAIDTAAVALSTTRASGLISASFRLRQGEFVELYVANGTDTGNITVADAIIEVS